MTTLHINRPSGFYLGQVRLFGHRLWDVVTDPCETAEGAMATAVLKMSPDHKRARVIFVTDCGYYEPLQVMECVR